MDHRFFRHSADDTVGPSPSTEDIVSAFRRAVGRKPGPSGGANTNSDGNEHSSPRQGAESESEPSRAALIESTIIAYHKARRHLDEENRTGPRGDEASTRVSRGGGGDVRPDGGARFSETEVRMGSDLEVNPEDSIEDFARAFRSALERRSDSSGDEAVTRTEESEKPKDDLGDTDQVDRSRAGPGGHGRGIGDGIPPSEEVEVSDGASTPTSSRPVQPESSFLWVADPPGDGSMSVSIDHLGERRAKEADAFLLSSESRNPYEQLTRIRGHSHPSIFLKPVFFMNFEGDESRVAGHVDWVWAQDERRELEVLKEKASTINQHVSTVMAGTETWEEGGRELRVLRFMATRDRTFAPHHDVENTDGFVYPMLTPLLDRNEEGGRGELLQLLSRLEERCLIEGEFVAHQFACRNCGSAFLNFEEQCPNCGASHLDALDLVHHFRCAFTGPLNEYKKKEGRLVCPKCDRFLKQIGVDYDKPGAVHACQRCREQFQEPEMQTTCYQCRQTAPPEQQVKREVKAYDVTALGEETAIYGESDSLLTILVRESRVLDYATFRLIVESEAARIERYQRSVASLLLVRVAGLPGLRRELGRRSQEVVEDIATAFTNTLRSSDYLSARDDSLYLFLLTETDEDAALRTGERLEENVESALSRNLEHPPRLDIGVQPLHPGVSLDEVTEQFLASNAQGRAGGGNR